MQPSCILLTGAPLTEQLDWSGFSLLLEHESTIPCRSSPPQSGVSQDNPSPRWRVVSNSLASKAGTDLAVDTNPPLVFDTSAKQPYAIEASFERYNDSELPLSQPGSVDGSCGEHGARDSYNTHLDETPDGRDDEHQRGASSELPSSVRFTDLRSLPDHDAVQRRLARTTTVNLLVVVIAVCPTRTVRLRRSSGQMNVTEIIVGDETRAGFRINIWTIPQAQTECQRDSFRHIVDTIRHGEILAILNLALKTYGGAVYGQTLGWRIAREPTTFFRMPKALAFLARTNKLHALREWSRQFVQAPALPEATLQDQQQTRRTLLPPDSYSE